MFRARNLLCLGTETLSLMVGVVTGNLTGCAAWARIADILMDSASFTWVTHMSDKFFFQFHKSIVAHLAKLVNINC